MRDTLKPSLFEYGIRALPRIIGTRRRRSLRKPCRSRAGFVNLFDQALTFLVVIALIIAGLALFLGNRETQRSNALVAMVVRAVTTIEEVHGFSGEYADESLLGFLEGRGFSDRELTKNSSGTYELTSPFDTGITIQGNGGRDFTVTVADLPQAPCTDLSLAFQDSGAGLDRLTIGGTAITLPMTESAVNTACDNAPKTVALTF
ncbi:type 4 pilus major pilin [Ruegeria atlantica]|uniref:type 4 pilus major pilin n=1 Tax=Ruegeria atlantica TaxID=81569 RepID=UPI001479A47F|nr:type 4 pilus major pilin [Ruegeria atlantica]